MTIIIFIILVVIIITIIIIIIIIFSTLGALYVTELSTIVGTHKCTRAHLLLIELSEGLNDGGGGGEKAVGDEEGGEIV